MANKTNDTSSKPVIEFFNTISRFLNQHIIVKNIIQLVSSTVIGWLINQIPGTWDDVNGQILITLFTFLVIYLFFEVLVGTDPDRAAINQIFAEREMFFNILDSTPEIAAPKQKNQARRIKLIKSGEKDAPEVYTEPLSTIKEELDLLCVAIKTYALTTAKKKPLETTAKMRKRDDNIAARILYRFSGLKNDTWELIHGKCYRTDDKKLLTSEHSPLMALLSSEGDVKLSQLETKNSLNKKGRYYHPGRDIPGEVYSFKIQAEGDLEDYFDAILEITTRRPTFQIDEEGERQANLDYLAALFSSHICVELGNLYMIKLREETEPKDSHPHSYSVAV
ncbi:MAG: hypothetical protein LBN05_00735 [Oscillospiraceae bacterium]|jgi:hypothetical protein|nr:hypothetical protein [Oscillospiraceae bacterium]